MVMLGAADRGQDRGVPIHALWRDPWSREGSRHGRHSGAGCKSARRRSKQAVTGNRSDDECAAGPEPRLPHAIKLDNSTMNVEGSSVTLSPGMAVAALSNC